ncbi:hypothetical protein [Brucella sp. 22210]|uniref:hypothetical protein n=1 Tax=Brucella sp. 22210 TaxID=3453892 RepID=UPI003F840E18
MTEPVFLMPFEQAAPSDFDEIKERIETIAPQFKAALLNRLIQFFEAYRNGIPDDDKTYGVACDLSTANVWSVISAAELADAMKGLDSQIQQSFIDGLPEVLRIELAGG